MAVCKEGFGVKSFVEQMNWLKDPGGQMGFVGAWTAPGGARWCRDEVATIASRGLRCRVPRRSPRSTWMMRQSDEDSESRRESKTPRDKAVASVRSFLLGRFTQENEDKIEVASADAYDEEPLPAVKQMKADGSLRPGYVPDGARAAEAAANEQMWGEIPVGPAGSARARRRPMTALDYEMLQWEQRYKGIFLEGERRNVLDTDPRELKDDAEKVTIGFLAIIVLVFIFKILFAFAQFLFSFTFSFFAIFALSGGIFVLFALARF